MPERGSTTQTWKADTEFTRIPLTLYPGNHSSSTFADTSQQRARCESVSQPITVGTGNIQMPRVTSRESLPPSPHDESRRWRQGEAGSYTSENDARGARSLPVSGRRYAPRRQRRRSARESIVSVDNAAESDRAAVDEEWDVICSLASTIARQFSLLQLPSNFDQPVTSFIYERGEVVKEASKAFQALGLDVVYNDELLATLGLKTFDPMHHIHNDAFLDAGVPIEVIFKDAADRQRDKGAGHQAVSQTLEWYPQRARVVEMLQQGQLPFMQPSFRHNNGEGFTQCKSVKAMGKILVNTLVGLIESGRAVAFDREAVIRSLTPQSQGVSISRLKWAPKAGSVLGRTCFNLTHGTKDHPSVNSSVDITAHDEHYPASYLCNVHDLCELAMLKQARYPGEQISGATVDVKDAYQQGANSPGVTALYGTQMDYISAITNKRVSLWVFYVVGVFGFTRAGHVYNTFGAAIDAVHNKGLDKRGSYTYVDDGIIIDAERLIDDSVERYCTPITYIMGPSGINDDKVKKLHRRLEAIGWVLCFESWRVFPREKGRNKMLAYLFHIIPIGCKSVQRVHLESLTGILSWYSAAIPAGLSFIASLFRALNRSQTSKRCTLGPLASKDLTWWRALALVSHRNPYVVGGSIANMRSNKVCSLFLQTDASTSVGGGATIAESLNGSPLAMDNECIRWTKREVEMFATWKVTINVLEYFTVVYYIMLWAHLMVGRVVHVECDNTSAVKWLMSNRARSECEGVDAITKLFSLFCLVYNITIVCVHIKGELNVIADLNSRSLMLAAQDADEAIMAGMPSGVSVRRAHLRQLLYRCVTRPSEMHLQTVLSELTHVQPEPG